MGWEHLTLSIKGMPSSSSKADVNASPGEWQLQDSFKVLSFISKLRTLKQADMPSFGECK
jgi:hypothetical protein